MDRQSIERRDFPIARRGYDIDAVNEHLARLADEYEVVRRGARPSKAGSVAAAASEQVRMIVDVAEQSASEIVRDAELESRQLRQDAREHAERVRNEAGQQARAHVAKVAEVAQVLLERAEGMDRELGTVLDGLRSGIRRLSADLSLLQANVGEFRDAAQAPPSAGAGGSPAQEEDEPELGFEAATVDSGSYDDDDDEAEDADGPVAAADDRAESAPVSDDGPDAAGVDVDAPGGAEPVSDTQAPSQLQAARMIALNMALNGVPREDTEIHLEEHFEIDPDDSAGLLDEVYLRAGEG